MLITPERQVVVIAPHYWGSGADEAEAKAALKRAGGPLNRGYTIFEFDPALADEFEIDPMTGSLAWWAQIGVDSEAARPKATDVAANGRRKPRPVA